MELSHPSVKKPRIVIIGAGIVGASIAFYLSRRHVNLTIIDQAEPGTGASSHSFAWINATSGKEPASYHDLNRRSVDMWSRFASLLQSDVGLRWGGELRWANTEEEADELRRGVELQQRRGSECRLLNEATFRALEPSIKPESFTIGALSVKDGIVEPSQVIQACLRYVQANGGTVSSNTEVTDFVMNGTGRGGRRIKAIRITSDRTTSGRITSGEMPCDVVVLAAGVGSTQLAAMIGLNIPQQDSPGVVVRTDPRPPLFKKIAVLNTPAGDANRPGMDANRPGMDANRPGIHVRQWTDGTVMIGEGSQESLARDDSQAHADALLKRATSYLPALAGARAIPVPVGHRPMPADELPILGFTQAVPNLYIALMHSGVTLAPLVGELSMIEIVEGIQVALLDSHRLERFR